MSLAKNSIYDGSPPIGSRMPQTIHSLAIAFVLHETFEELKVAGFPIAQVGFFDHDRCADAPTECRLVIESNVYE
jgi:hypothetical protein